MALSRTRAQRKEDVCNPDYDRGFAAHLAGVSFDFDKPLPWRRGWLEADTHAEPPDDKA